MYLLGCRAGALLAAQAAADGLSVERLILWQPVVSGRGYLGQLRTRRMVQEKMTGEEPVEVGKYEVEGQELSPEFYTELEQSDAARAAAGQRSAPAAMLLQRKTAE